MGENEIDNGQDFLGPEIESFSKGVVGIFTSSKKGEPMVEHSLIEVTEDGLKDDRYEGRAGAYSGTKYPDDWRAVSIISTEGIRLANEELGRKGIRPFTNTETRRNIVIEIDAGELNSLEGRRFSIGEVELEGTVPCKPCRRPAKLLKRSGLEGKAFEEAFEGRGGLRAKVIKPGTIHKKDTLSVIE